MAGSASPRVLRLLRIDDDISRGNREDPPLQHIDQMAPKHLETVFVRDGASEVSGIRNWATAIQFWRGLTPGTRIDLIVSDIKFVDDSSPLNRLALPGIPLALPTGLSHFKPLAAMARMSGAPLGVAIHTKDAPIWGNGAGNNAPPAVQALSLLAAHEIGELAAILNRDDAHLETGPDACWAWLNEATASSTDFYGALKIALPDYRRQLTRARMLPNDWEALFAWCECMHTKAEASTPPGVLLDEAGEAAVRIIADSGEEDFISLKSLFADVPLARRGFSFDFFRLPARCFALEQMPSYHNLDEDSYPRIGALILECGDLSRSYSKALDILKRFPVPPELPVQSSITEMKDEEDWPPFAVGLAILLQDVFCHWVLYREWKAFYEGQEWDAERDEFVGRDADTGRTLASRVARVYDQLHRNGSETVKGIVELLCGAEGSPRDPTQFGHFGARRCLDLLVDAGIATYEPTTGTYRIAQRGARIRGSYMPPRPKQPPAGFLRFSDLGPAFTDDRKTFIDESRRLRIVFGLDDLSSHNGSAKTAALERQIQYAFRLPNPPAGTAFLKKFRSGHGPGWVKALCRNFARTELEWDDERNWPASIR